LLSLRLRHVSQEFPDLIRQRIAGVEQLVRYNTPGLDYLSACLLQLCSARVAVPSRDVRLPSNALEALASSPRIPALRRAIDPVAYRCSHLSSHGPLSGICRDALSPQLRRKATPPPTKGRLAYLQPLAVLADRFDDQVHVRMVLIGVQDHEVAMFEREFLACEVSACGEEFLW
jgi:hypothetical protein